MGEKTNFSRILTPKNTVEFDKNLDILIALLPTAIVACVYFGAHAMFMMLVCMGVSTLSAFLAGKLLAVEEDPRNLSAAIVGMLIAMTMPSGFSIPAAAVCAAAGVIVPRMMFGGNGCEIVSPVAFGSIMAFLCFPSIFYYNEAFTNLHTFYVPFETSLTLKQLIFGAHAGAVGETAAVFLAIGAVYLSVRKIITPTIPVFALLFTALFSFAFSMDVLSSVLSGGTLLAAIFILPERNLCPHGFLGKVAYAAVFSLLTVIIRKYAAAPEGVYFAVLTVQLIRPLFDVIPDIRRKSDERN